MTCALRQVRDPQTCCKQLLGPLNSPSSSASKWTSSSTPAINNLDRAKRVDGATRKGPKLQLLTIEKLNQRKPMKTEEHPEPTAVFIQRVTAAVSELKDHLEQDYERTYPGLGEIIRIVVDEEEAKAWELSFFPHLFLPDMVKAHIATLELEPAETRHSDVVAAIDESALSAC
jgi:hypothetical protein